MQFSYGVSTTPSSPTIRNCNIVGNRADGQGGGFYSYYGFSEITNCSFTGNEADQGGGLYVEMTTQALLEDNTLSMPSTLYITNCTFSGNEASLGGGLYLDSGSFIITNCTASGNSAEVNGGGFHLSNSTVSIINSIIWNNRADGVSNTASASVYFGIQASMTFYYSLVANSGGSGGSWDSDVGIDGGDNIDEDPLFVADVNLGASFPNTSGDLRLTGCSPAINAGDNTANGESFDVDGNNRIFNEVIDLGSFEYQFYYGSACECPMENVIYVTGNNDWSDIESTYSIPVSFGNVTNLQIHVDGVLNFDIIRGFGYCTFIMEEDAELIVDENIEIIFYFSTFTSCEDQWKGIELSSNVTARISTCEIENAETGIKSWAGSNIAIEKTHFQNCHTGMSLSGSINILLFDFNIFENGTTGVSVLNATNFVRLSAVSSLNANHFTNLQYGINMNYAHGLIRFNHFTFMPRAIQLIQSHETEVTENTIDNTLSFGIRIENSRGCTIHNNKIGLAGNNMGTGVLLDGGRSTYTSDIHISENKINTQRIGIFSMHGNFHEYSYNNISITGNPDRLTGGVLMSTTNRTSVLNNEINMTESQFGIEAENCYGFGIIENSIVSSTLNWRHTSAGIRSLGSSGAFIANNDLNIGGVFGAGITAVNAFDQIYQCNYSKALLALAIGHNAPMQEIKGNELDGSAYDLSIQSEIGVQYHHGNLFIGGNAIADGLTIIELIGSLFYVNDNITNNMPTNPTPGNGEWFVNENETPYSCPGTMEFVSSEFYSDSMAICQYWERVKDIRTSFPGAFIERTLQLMEGITAMDSISVPDCIMLDTVFTNTCGIEDIFDLYMRYQEIFRDDERDLEEIGSIIEDINLWKDSITIAITLEDDEKTELYQNNLRPYLSALYSICDSISLARENLAAGILTDLQYFSCTDSIMIARKNILRLTLEHTTGFEADSSDMEELRSYSELCAETWGSMIYKARSLNALFDTLAYEENDGCMTSQMLISSTGDTTLIEEEVMWYPNPSKGNLHIYIPANENSNLTIYDLIGRRLWNSELNSNMNVLQHQLPDGMYLGHITRDGKTFKIIKFIVTR